MDNDTVGMAYDKVEVVEIIEVVVVTVVVVVTSIAAASSCSSNSNKNRQVGKYSSNNNIEYMYVCIHKRALLNINYYLI